MRVGTTLMKNECTNRVISAPGREESALRTEWVAVFGVKWLSRTQMTTHREHCLRTELLRVSREWGMLSVRNSTNSLRYVSEPIRSWNFEIIRCLWRGKRYCRDSRRTWCPINTIATTSVYIFSYAQLNYYVCCKTYIRYGNNMLYIEIHYASLTNQEG